MEARRLFQSYHIVGSGEQRYTHLQNHDRYGGSLEREALCMWVFTRYNWSTSFEATCKMVGKKNIEKTTPVRKERRFNSSLVGQPNVRSLVSCPSYQIASIWDDTHKSGTGESSYPRPVTKSQDLLLKMETEPPTTLRRISSCKRSMLALPGDIMKQDGGL